MKMQTLMPFVAALAIALAGCGARAASHSRRPDVSDKPPYIGMPAELIGATWLRPAAAMSNRNRRKNGSTPGFARVSVANRDSRHRARSHALLASR